MTPEISLTRDPAHARHGSNIGQPLTRRDGILKVKGEARYAADNHPPGMLHAVLAVSGIARGRVTFLDVQAAKSHPGVVDVMTPTNRPPLAEDPDAKTNPFMFRLAVVTAIPGVAGPCRSRCR
jgi:xanthine dehydrogenase YagR molybdenum-binding subunit